MRRNPALIDLHLFMAKTKIAQVKISSESSSIESKIDSHEHVDNSTIQ